VFVLTRVRHIKVVALHSRRQVIKVVMVLLMVVERVKIIDRDHVVRQKVKLRSGEPVMVHSTACQQQLDVDKTRHISGAQVQFFHSLACHGKQKSGIKLLRSLHAHTAAGHSNKRTPTAHV